ncbi:MAG: DUF3240 family protein [Algiphilus sp.]
MTHKATEVTIVTEKVIQDQIVAIIEAEGATGYTVIEGSGKGRHGVRTHARPSVAGDAFDIVKIEVILANRAAAERIAEQVADKLFTYYSGIVYLEEVEILRRSRFGD